MSKKRTKEPKLLSEQLRDIILTGGRTRYAIAKAANIDQAQMSRFVKGTGRLTTDTLDRIGAVLRLRLVVDADPNE
jgi:plasmid maintenance system antidote protein VapI